jgi:hypothetical protein
MDVNVADLMQLGGVGAFAFVVWYELRTGLRDIGAKLELLIDRIGSEMKDFRRDLYASNKEIYERLTTTQERLEELLRIERETSDKNKPPSEREKDKKHVGRV